MLIKPKPIDYEAKKEEATRLSPSSFAHKSNTVNDYVAGILDEHIGDLRQGETRHFYSFGNFNSMRLIFHILSRTGPAKILMSSYGISPKTITGIKNRIDQGEIQDFRLLIDNRVRSISPKPFDMIVRNFNYRFTSIHAKVACIYNNEWKVTLISSQNATDNPKIERGIIYTDPDIFNFDFNTLNDAFYRGTT